MCGNRTHPPTPQRRGYGFEVRGAHQVPFHSHCAAAQSNVATQSLKSKREVSQFPPTTRRLMSRSPFEKNERPRELTANPSVPNKICRQSNWRGNGDVPLDTPRWGQTSVPQQSRTANAPNLFLTCERRKSRRKFLPRLLCCPAKRGTLPLVSGCGKSSSRLLPFGGSLVFRGSSPRPFLFVSKIPSRVFGDDHGGPHFSPACCTLQAFAVLPSVFICSHSDSRSERSWIFLSSETPDSAASKL